MIILGLGSNVGDRLSILRQALTLIEKIPTLSVQQVSPVYISDALMPEGAPDNWNMPYLNCALRCEADLNPQHLLTLLKNIENQLGRKPHEKWAPRPVDIDILAWDNMVCANETLHIPHEHLHTRPFALWPLADVAASWNDPIFNKTAIEIAAQWGSRLSGEAPFRTRQIPQRIDTPQLVGILNITPDSFSDAKIFMLVDQAMQQCISLVESGAEVLDFGAEATSPGAAAISPEEEWRRLEGILSEIISQKNSLLITPKISIDTRHPETAKKALALGIDWINDVSGLSNPAMREIIAANHCDVVIMHELGLPADATQVLPLEKNPLEAVYAWGENTLASLATAGIQRDRIILDVGIGFGKNPQQSLSLLKQINEFKRLNTRLMVGHSRKSFLKQFTLKSAAERDVETLSISLYLAEQAVDYLRLHNVDMCARAFKVTKALTEG
jgi:2-amino-4-hydroxy-6-hydroxymethyldihydropteridine diphosphokinase/dihydropteroate synthase